MVAWRGDGGECPPSVAVVSCHGVTAPTAVGGGSLRFSCVCHARADRVAVRSGTRERNYTTRIPRVTTKELSDHPRMAVSRNDLDKYCSVRRTTHESGTLPGSARGAGEVEVGTSGTRTACGQIFPPPDASRRCMPTRQRVCSTPPCSNVALIHEHSVVLGRLGVALLADSFAAPPRQVPLPLFFCVCLIPSPPARPAGGGSVTSRSGGSVCQPLSLPRCAASSSPLFPLPSRCPPPPPSSHLGRGDDEMLSLGALVTTISCGAHRPGALLPAPAPAEGWVVWAAFSLFFRPTCGHTLRPRPGDGAAGPRYRRAAPLPVAAASPCGSVARRGGGEGGGWG